MMSTRVCSPPNMDLTRDMLAQSCHNPSTTSASSLPSSSHESAASGTGPQRFFGPGSSIPSTDIKTPRRNVARNLFGPPDPRSTQYARQKVIEMRDNDIKRWNFDFDKEKPLEGRYKWEPVSISPERSVEAGDNSRFHIPKPYALSRLPFLSSSSSSSSTVSSPCSTPTSKESLCEREPLLIVLPLESNSSSPRGSGDSEPEVLENEPYSRLTGDHALMSTIEETRLCCRSESHSVSSASSQYSLPSPSRSPPAEHIDPTTIPIPSPPEDCSSSSSSTASYTTPSVLEDHVEPVPTVLDTNDREAFKVRIKKKSSPKQTLIKDFMREVRPVKRSSSQTTGVPEKKAAM